MEKGSSVRDETSCRRVSVVPTGTVLLTTMRVKPRMLAAMSRVADRILSRSGFPSSPWGVSTQRNTTSASAAAAGVSVVKLSRPASTLRATRSARPGSCESSSRRSRRSILSESISAQRTSCPSALKQAPVTRPTFPVPMIESFMVAFLRSRPDSPGPVRDYCKVSPHRGGISNQKNSPWPADGSLHGGKQAPYSVQRRLFGANRKKDGARTSLGKSCPSPETVPTGSRVAESRL